MSNDTILDSEELNSDSTLSKKQLKRKKLKYFLIFLASATINSVLANIYSKQIAYILPPDPTRNISMFFLGTLIWGFLLAAIFNFIPYKKISFWKRYSRTAFIVAIILNSLILFNMIFKIILTYTA